jgi:hypothetical protein
MEASIKSILAGFYGQIALFSLLAFLGREIFKKMLEKQLNENIEKFRAKLHRTATDHESELHRAATEHQIQFSKFHEKRAEVLAELYRRLVIAAREAQNFLSLLQWSGEQTHEQKYEEAMRANVDYFCFVDESRVYLPNHLCTVLDSFGQKLRSPIVHLGVYLNFDQPTEGTKKEKTEAWIKGWRSVEEDIPPLRREIEDELRKLLGAPASA